MSRWIDIDDDRNCYIGMDGDYEKYNIDSDVLAEAFSDSPQIRVGRWVDTGVMAYMCSACGYGVQPWNNTPYCPNRGAYMKAGSGPDPIL